MLKRLLALTLSVATAVSLFAVAADEASALSTLTSTSSLQAELRDKGFYRGPIDGRYGAQTQQAVMAFRKEIGAVRSFSWSDSLWDELESYVRPWVPFRMGEPQRIEINLTRQVMYYFDQGELQGIFPISSGNGEPYQNSFGSFSYAHTPTGDFKIQRHIRGERISYLGSLWNPWYFSGGYAIHGSGSVPAYPASHGCVRLTMWDSDWLESRLGIGVPVHIWHEPAGAGPTLAPGGDLGIGGSTGCQDGNCDSVVFGKDTGLFYFWDQLSHDPAVTPMWYGVGGDIPFSGDWDGDGIETLGLYRQSDGFVYLRNSNTEGIADVTFYFGIPGDVPIAGDFNGDGKDTVSIYRPSEQRVYIINELGENGGGLGAAELSYQYGAPGDRPFAGDFDGDGHDTIGLHRPSDGRVYLKNSHTEGVADRAFVFGIAGDEMVAGDWDGDGVDTVGVYRPRWGVLYVKNSHSSGYADAGFDVGYLESVVAISR